MRPVEEYVRIIEVWSTEMEDWSTEIVSSTDPQRVCDFNSMETFFRLIGQNMHRIRHIELEFRIISSFTHCTFLFRIGNPLYNQPEVLYDALEFLADSNSVGRGLKTLEIKHPDTTNSGPPPAGQHQSGATNHANPQATFELFMSHPDPMHSLLGDSLRRLKGVKLICKEVEAWKDEGHEFCMACYQARGLLAIKADMMR